MGSWPVIIPPGPGVLCAYGDATTRIRDESSRSFIRNFNETSDKEVTGILKDLAKLAATELNAEGVPSSEQSTSYEIDVRYHGQGLVLTIEMDPKKLPKEGLKGISKQFDKVHEQMFTFALEHDHELVNLRAIQQGKATKVKAEKVGTGRGEPTKAVTSTTKIYFEGKSRKTKIYDRSMLLSGHKIPGPAIVEEMDSTTLILPGHHGTVDTYGNILIRPDGKSGGKAKARSGARRPAAKKASARKSTARKSTTRKSAAKKSLARKSVAKKAKSSKKAKSAKAKRR
jgi:N-methylhydantoinase A